MQNLVKESFNSFNPDIQITRTEGKSFAIDSFPFHEIRNLREVKSVEPIVSDLTLITYEERQMLVRLKGIGDGYAAARNMDRILIDGDFILTQGPFHYGVLGAIAAGTLQINLNSPETLQVYYPKRTRRNFINPAEAFTKQFLIPSGVFATNTQYDEQFIFCDIDFARELMQYENEVTSVEVILHENAELAPARKKVEQLAGGSYLVQDKYQQEESLFKTIESEKLIIFFILSFILLVATFNIIGTLGMLIIEKKKDIAILHSLGARTSFIGKIFILEGMFISFLGGIIGMGIGGIICFIQQYFHIIKLGGGDSHYVINYYPVAMSGSDFLIVLATIIVISFLASWIPTKIIKKEFFK